MKQGIETCEHPHRGAASQGERSADTKVLWPEYAQVKKKMSQSFGYFLMQIYSLYYSYSSAISSSYRVTVKENYVNSPRRYIARILHV